MIVDGGKKLKQHDRIIWCKTEMYPIGGINPRLTVFDSEPRPASSTPVGGPARCPLVGQLTGHLTGQLT